MMEGWILLLVAITTTGADEKPLPRSDISSLVEAERRFDRASVENGMRAAFLENLAEESVVFRPRPVDGHRWFSNTPEIQGTLTWTPTFAEISSAGDLGYTSGPWTFTPKSEEQGPPQHGHYVSIWRFEEDGRWRVVLDLGVVHAPASSTAALKLREPRPSTDGGESVDDLHAALMGADSAMSEAAAEMGLEAAMRAASAKDVHVYRMGHEPGRGRDAIAATLAGSAVPENWRPTGGGVARSGDLGYTYGLMFRSRENMGFASDSYTRIWRRSEGGDWELALDIAIPIPEPTPPPQP